MSTGSHFWSQIHGLMQERCNSIANTLELHQSCTNPLKWCNFFHSFTGDPLHSRAACTQPCNVNTHSRAHCSRGTRLCEQWVHGCVNNGARLCASARLCRGSPVSFPWEIWLKFLLSNFQGDFSDWWPRYLLWNWPQANTTGPYYQ